MEKILMVEDDVQLRETLAEILQVVGYTVSQAENGKEGIEIFYKIAPDLVICDVSMPGIDGFGVLEKLKELKAKLPPFIFLSAKTEEINIKRAIDLGAVDFIAKPYSVVELLKIIDLRLKK